MLAYLRDYARSFAPDVQCAALDFDHGLELIQGDFTEDLFTAHEARRRFRRERATPVRAAKRRHVFSDLNEWLIKVLIAPRLSEDLLTAPRNSFTSSTELADMAEVSQPSAWRLLKQLTNQGYLRKEGHSFELMRVRELMDRWGTAAREQSEVGAVWLLPQGDHVRQLRDAVKKSVEHEQEARLALGLFAACDALGLGIAEGVLPHLYVEDLEQLESLGLSLASSGEQPHVLARVPRSPESLFRARVFPDGVPTTDVLQCWLDLHTYPARGIEQADYLWSRTLGDALNDVA